MSNRTSKAWEALQNTLSQTVETVTRASRVDIVGGGVDEIDPPEDIDQFAEQAKTNAIARANLRKFVLDVWEPGYRVEGPDETVQYFEGNQEDIDSSPPEGTPEGGFLNQSSVFAGERHQDFYDFGKECTWQRWARGTVLIEYLKQDGDDPESQISGFSFVRPETVYPQVENNTNILLEPDFEDLPDDIDRNDVTFTRRDEVAAYIQFDDESILGLRRNGFDEQDIPLSQNDVLKQTLEADIGGDIQKGEGVFGTSALEPVSTDITEYEQTKRDRFEAIQRKAYGIWTAQFTPETIDLGERKEVIEWADDSIQDTEKELIDMGPGDVLTSDANIDLERHSGEVPELDPVLMHYVKEISSALPVPLPMAVDFAGDINRDVTSDQRAGYEQTVSEERQYQETSWTQALRFIAERAGLPTEGLQFKIQPKVQDNPVKSLSTEEIDRMNTYVQTLSAAAGPRAGPTALVDREDILEVLDFPESEDASPEDIAEGMAEMGEEATQQAWGDIMGLEALEGNELFADVPVVPTGIDTLTNAWLVRWAEWVAAGKPEIPKEEALDWNPSLHPRNPETGQFVERPFSIPDDIPDFESMGPKGTLSYLDEQGEDVGAILDPESGVTIDGVPNDATSLDDIPETDSDVESPFGEPSDTAQDAIDRIDEVADSDITDTLGELEDVVNEQVGPDVELVGSEAESARVGKELVRLDDAGQLNGVDTFLYDQTSSTRGSAGAFSRLDNQVVVNPEVVEGEEYQEWADENKIGGGTVEWAVRHEVGHAEHRNSMSLDESRSVNGASFDSEEESAIEDSISEYASSKPTEFVAEAYAWKVSGNGELPGFLEGTYEAFNGPEVNNG